MGRTRLVVWRGTDEFRAESAAVELYDGGLRATGTQIGADYRVDYELDATGADFVTNALTAKRIDPSVTVPWSGYDLINTFNAWKKSEEAGRAFVVAADGSICKQVTGLAWRHTISA